MRLLINDTEIALSPEQEITTQENSPLDSLKQQGDKAFTFAVPQSPILREQLAARLHKQGKFYSQKTTAKLTDGPFTVFEGDLQVKRQNRLAAELNMTVPPGGISSEFWNKKLGEIELASYDLPTQPFLDPIYVVKTTDLGFNTSTGKDVAFGLYYLANGTTLRIKLGTQAIFEHTFLLSGLDFDTRRSTALAELTSALTEYNEAPVIAASEIYASQTEISLVLPNTSAQINVEIYFDAVAIGTGLLPFTMTWNNLQRIAHDSPVTHLQVKGSRESISEGAEEYLWFPSVFAPNFYSEKTDRYNGSVNSRDGGNLQTNSYAARTNFPLVPAFRWLYVIDLLLAKHDYSRSGDWSAWDKLALMAMKDFARQHPSTVLPFNVYPTTMTVQYYLPDWTVKEFFDEFMIQTGSLLIWDIAKKELRIKSFNAILEAPSLELPDVEFVDEDYEEQKQYAVTYSKVIDDELLDDEIKGFFGTEDTTEGFTEVTQKAIPFPALPEDYTRRATAFNAIPQDRANGTWIGVLTDPTEDSPTLFSMDAGRSVLFNLYDTDPVPRILYLDGQEAVNSDVYSLSRAEDNSMAKELVLPLINAKTGRKVNLRGYFHSVLLLQLNFETTIHYLGSRYLLSKKEPTFRQNKSRHETLLELEKLD